MNPEAIARAGRREQALEALESERGREAALREQLAALVTEAEGPRVDQAAYARMSPEDVELVRAAFDTEGFELDADEDDWIGLGEISLGEEESDAAGSQEEYEGEIARLQAEIAASRRRQQAFERYVEALGE